MNMQAKRIITIVVGLAMAGLTAWKGASVAADVVATVSALALLVGTLHIVPAKDQEYIDDLEDAVKEHAPVAVSAKLVKDGAS